MTAGDWGSIASAGAAWLALVLAGISLYKNHRSDKRQDKLAASTAELNRLLIEREAQASQENKRADVSANLITVRKNSYKLKVFNKGKCTARNVRLVDLQENRSILDSDDIRQKFPLPSLEQHQSVEVLAVILLSGPRGSHIKLVWDDELGSDHEKELWPRL